MLIQLLLLRTTILFRKTKELPFASTAILLVLLALVFYIFIKICSTSPYDIYAISAFSFILLTIHEGRKDYHFCKIILTHPFELFTIEYILIAVPFFIITIIQKHFVIGVLYIIFPILIACLPQFRYKSARNKRPFRIQLPSLESISFFRKFRIVIWIIYLTALCLCFVRAISIIIVYIVIIFFACTSFSQAESLTLLCINEVPAKIFINQKIKAETLFWWKFFLPVYVLYAFFNIETLFIILIPLLLGPLFIIFCICAKYRQFKPNAPINGTVFQSLGFVGFFIPILLPVSIFLTIVYYSQSIDHLNHYLNAYNK